MSVARCPHCGERQTDLYELWPENYGCDSWRAETQCGSCERPVRVVCRVSVDYDIEPLADPETASGGAQ